MPNSRRSSWLVALALVAVAESVPSAHRLDEYLHAARLGIDPDRVELVLDLTPGMAVAERVLAEIDRDGDKAISPAEERAHAQRILSAITLDVDRQPVRVDLVDTTMPTIEAMRHGAGTMRLRVQASLPRLDGGDHQLRFRNTYRSDDAVYLANALVPASDRVTITAQRRDVDQRELTIDYTLRSTRSAGIGNGFLLAIAGAFLWLTLARRRGPR